MPIVDGLTSTKMIRSYEKSPENAGLSSLAVNNGRVPIFAVSASLVEREKPTYIQAGFDGWILKPIDFKRLNTLLHGIVDEDVRKTCLYKPGQWERGGWFNKPAPGKPTSEKPTSERPDGSPDSSAEGTLKADIETKDFADTKVSEDDQTKNEPA